MYFVISILVGGAWSCSELSGGAFILFLGAKPVHLELQP